MFGGRCPRVQQVRKTPEEVGQHACPTILGQPPCSVHRAKGEAKALPGLGVGRADTPVAQHGKNCPCKFGQQATPLTFGQLLWALQALMPRSIGGRVGGATAVVGDGAFQPEMTKGVVVLGAASLPQSLWIYSPAMAVVAKSVELMKSLLVSGYPKV